MDARTLKLNIEKNAPAILSGLAVAGIITTAIFSSLSAIKAVELIDKARETKGNKPLTKKEILWTVAPVYVPTVVIAGATILCVFGINRYNRKSQMAIASLYSMTDQTLRDYRAKVKELYGDEADKDVTDAIIKDIDEEIDAELSKEGRDWNTMFYEPITDCYFYSDKVTVLRAAYELNRKITLKGCASVNNYLGYLGLSTKDYCDNLGWSAIEGAMATYNGNWIDVGLIKKHKNGNVCYELEYSLEPIYGFEEY